MSDFYEKTKKTSHSKKSESPNIVASMLEYVEILVFSLAFVVLIFTFCIRLCGVSGGSMRTTLHNGEKLLVSNMFYEPECEDIIVFHQTGMYLNEPVVKRVIAVGGEKVHIDFNTWTVTITDKDGNQRVLEEDYIFLDDDPIVKSAYYMHPTDYDFSEPIVIPEGHLFVMGDNRYNSLDSRFHDVGLVDERRILGKVIFRITPFDKFGTVN